MNFTLTRMECASDGIWGVLSDEQGDVVAHTLEHAYDTDTGYQAKLPEGTYTLTLGTHQLEHGSPFQVYCVPPFTGWDGQTHEDVLIHPGNVQADSQGCILVGTSLGEIRDERAILASRYAFAKFMILAKTQTIELTVRDVS